MLVDMSTIGQLSVGFFSACLASDKVRVVSKNNDDAQCADKSEKTVKHRLGSCSRSSRLRDSIWTCQPSSPSSRQSALRR